MTTETKNTRQIEATTDAQALTVRFDIVGLAPVMIDANQLTASLLNHAIVHGLKQKIGDAAAISRDPETGRSATLADKRAAMMRVVEQLMAGDWNRTREGGTGAAGGLLFQALCRMQPNKPAAEVRAWLDAKTKEEQASLRKNPRVAPIIAAIQAERVKTDGIDSDDLLEDLMGGE